ncbi:MAG: ExbD/TolR family protein [Gloeotrichia echinulata DVL01]|jgi:biopolymer transport protein ExbD|nr:biopolymer transporter ExbD [Gloeotrichia echinulata DEX184]
MRLPDEPDIPAQINIVPMIDVIFAILTFFIMSTLYLTRSEGLPVNLPKAASAQQQQQRSTEPITVTLDATGNISLNRKPVPLDGLANQVRGLIGANAEGLVIINADERVNHGQVVAVMDRLRQVQGAKLAIATQKP